jgi:serine/threonine protein kinase
MAWRATLGSLINVLCFQFSCRFWMFWRPCTAPLWCMVKFARRGSGCAAMAARSCFHPSASFSGAEESDGEQRLALVPGYAPIESYCLEGRLNAASDIYALAAVAYTLITGLRPVDAPLRLLGDKQPRLAECAATPAFSPEFLCLIDQALAPDPASRPQDAAAFAQSLVQAAPRAGEVVTASPAQAMVFALEPSAQSAIQSALAEYIGPIASVVLKKALASAKDWATLSAALAGHVHEESAQQKFSASNRASAAAGSGSSSVGAGKYRRGVENDSLPQRPRAVSIPRCCRNLRLSWQTRSARLRELFSSAAFRERAIVRSFSKYLPTRWAIPPWVKNS